ncbi:hypothetical protein EPO04_02015 [Patescibacteria group bacterium]|nr:MAG: hypothetical protein EPO04_02015 [Patescibacteria group bacterium]
MKIVWPGWRQFLRALVVLPTCRYASEEVALRRYAAAEGEIRSVWLLRREFDAAQWRDGFSNAQQAFAARVEILDHTDPSISLRRGFVTAVLARWDRQARSGTTSTTEALVAPSGMTGKTTC